MQHGEDSVPHNLNELVQERNLAIICGPGREWETQETQETQEEEGFYAHPLIQSC